MDDNDCSIEEYKFTTDTACTTNVAVGGATKYALIDDGNGNLISLDIDLSIAFTD